MQPVAVRRVEFWIGVGEPNGSCIHEKRLDKEYIGDKISFRLLIDFQLIKYYMLRVLMFILFAYPTPPAPFYMLRCLMFSVRSATTVAVAGWPEFLTAK